MHVAEAIRIALQSLWVNKLRSVLTLLGVVIGVAAVIAVVTFVSGINDYVAQKIFNLGADVFIIFKVSPAVTNVDHFLEGEKRKDLTMEDYQAVADACRHCEYMGAVLRNESWPCEVRRAIDQRHFGAWHHSLDGSDLRYRSELWPHAERDGPE